MTPTPSLFLAAACVIIPLTWLGTSYPIAIAIGIAVLCVVVALAKIPGWWQRSYVITIFAMYAGASHFEALAVVGGIGKMVSLALLTLVTFITTRGLKPHYFSRLHKLVSYSLWSAAGLATVSIIWSEDRVESMTQIPAFIGFVFILHKTSTVRWHNKATLIRDMSLAYWSSCIALALGVLLALGGVSGAVSDYSGRYLGVLGNPNRLGIVAAMTFAIGLGVAVYRKNMLVWATLLIPLSQVLLSQSRTSILAVAVGLLWVLARGGIVRVIGVCFSAILGLFISSAFSFNPVGETLSRFGERQGGDIFNSRTSAWGDVFSLLQQNPLGVGWAVTNSAFAEMNEAGVTSGLVSVHNSYFQLLFELGWVGAIPAVLTFLLFMAVIVRGAVSGQAVGFTVAVVSGALIHLTESAIFGIGQPYPYLFWFAVIAAVVSADMRTISFEQTKSTQKLPQRVASAL